MLTQEFNKFLEFKNLFLYTKKEDSSRIISMFRQQRIDLKWRDMDKQNIRVAIIGSRCFNDYGKLCEFMSKVNDKINVVEIVSGGAIGADSLATRYANENDIKLNIYLPDWGKYGRRAGILRNDLIINNSDYIVAFWDGKSKGTKYSIEKAKKLNKKMSILSVA
jgi:orotate phosphoribosyltransferase-like protein